MEWIDLGFPDVGGHICQRRCIRTLFQGRFQGRWKTFGLTVALQRGEGLPNQLFLLCGSKRVGVDDGGVCPV